MIGSRFLVLGIVGCSAGKGPAHALPTALDGHSVDPALAAVAAEADCPGATLKRLSSYPSKRGIVTGLVGFKGCGREETYAFGADGNAFVIDGPVQLYDKAPFATLTLGCHVVGGFRDVFWVYATEVALSEEELPSTWFHPWDQPGSEGQAMATRLEAALEHPPLGGEYGLSITIPLTDVHVRWLPEASIGEVMCMRILAPSGDPILYDCVSVAEGAEVPDLELCMAHPGALDPEVKE